MARSGGVLAAPKSAWARNKAAHGKKAMMDALRGKRSEPSAKKIRSRDDSSTMCPDTPAISVKAPKENVWGELSGPDAAAVVAFLFAQSELNLTTTNNATGWDNTL